MVDIFTIPSIMTDLRTMVVIMVKLGTVVREMGIAPLEIEGKVEKISEMHSMVEVEDEVGLIKSKCQLP